MKITKYIELTGDDLAKFLSKGKAFDEFRIMDVEIILNDDTALQRVQRFNNIKELKIKVELINE